MSDPQFCIIDFETAGLYPALNAIVSVGVVRLDENLEEVDRWYTVIKDYPDKVISDEALKVNGITREEIEAGMPVDLALNILNGVFLHGCVPVAHNASFDFDFLRKRGFDYPEAICTMENSMRIWPTQKAKLGLVYNRIYGHDFTGAHNALDDTLACADVLRWQAKKDPKYLIPKPINYERFKR